MDKIYIFNPETDFALAHGGEYYTPNRRITELKTKLALLPTVYAESGSNILVPKKCEQVSPIFSDIIQRKNLSIIEPDEIIRFANKPVAIYPWGWNLSLRRHLLNLGLSEEYLPDIKRIHLLKGLSHRRLTIEFHKRFNKLAKMNIPLPKESDDYDFIMQWCSEHPGGYLKAPWSSSGRGIFRAMNPHGQELRTWVNGTIRRQKSIMLEEPGDKLLDFATEWFCSGNKSEFVGFSVFSTDIHSQYIGNIFASQDELKNIIIKASNNSWNDNLLTIQKNMIDELISPFYEGALGVDCMVCKNGMINMCVEVNLRMTMGHVAIAAISDNINPALII